MDASNGVPIQEPGFLNCPFLCKERKVVEFLEMPLASEHRQEACYLLSKEGEELLVWASKSLLSLHGINLLFLVPVLVTWLNTNFWELIKKEQAGPSFSRGLDTLQELRMRVWGIQRLSTKFVDLVMQSW